MIKSRCNIIKVKGYTDIEERKVILNKYILPKLYNSYEITEDEANLNEEAIIEIIDKTKEKAGGVRLLEQQCDNIFKEMILDMVMENKPAYDTSLSKIRSILSETKDFDGKATIGF